MKHHTNKRFYRLLTAAAWLSLPLSSLSSWAAPPTLAEATTTQSQVITRHHQHTFHPAPAANFDGTARFARFPVMPSAGDVAPAIVHFDANAKTHWHIHHHGQYLIVTSGEGFIQAWGSAAERIKVGDVIWCPPGVKHWHGAAPDQPMTHVAITPVATVTPNVTWLEPVE